MVDFTLTEEPTNIIALAHDFAAKVIRPLAWEYDKDGSNWWRAGTPTQESSTSICCSTRCPRPVS